MDFLQVRLQETPPIASVDQNGERAEKIFSQRWPVVLRMLNLLAEQEMNVNAGHSDDFPDIERMTGDVRVDSIEYSADASGNPVAFYMLRCGAKGGGTYMSIEAMFGVRQDGESIFVSQSNVSAG